MPAAAITFLADFPLALYLRGWFGLSEPDPMPVGFRADKSFSLTYWAPWATAWAILVLPGLILLASRRTRPAGIAYIITATLVAAMVSFFGISFEYGGSPVS